jgi:hypothetical protein
VEDGHAAERLVLMLIIRLRYRQQDAHRMNDIRLAGRIFAMAVGLDGKIDRGLQEGGHCPFLNLAAAEGNVDFSLAGLESVLHPLRSYVSARR